MGKGFPEDIGKEFKRIIKGLSDEIEEVKVDDDGDDTEIQIKIVSGKIDKALDQLDKHLPKEIADLIRKKVENAPKLDPKEGRKSARLVKRHVADTVAKIVSIIPSGMIEKDFLEADSVEEIRPELFSIVLSIITFLHANKYIELTKKEEE